MFPHFKATSLFFGPSIFHILRKLLANLCTFDQYIREVDVLADNQLFSYISIVHFRLINENLKLRKVMVVPVLWRENINKKSRKTKI